VTTLREGDLDEVQLIDVREQNEVGLYTLNPVDPCLESAWSQPLSLPLEPAYKVISWFHKVCLQIKLVPLR
jgi:hypothetical protein